MTEGLLDRYFRLLAGQLPAAKYGVIADASDDTSATGPAMPVARECLC